MRLAGEELTAASVLWLPQEFSSGLGSRSEKRRLAPAVLVSGGKAKAERPPRDDGPKLTRVN